jgi:hypothetical protein
MTGKAAVRVVFACLAVGAAGCSHPLIPQTPPSVRTLRTSDAPARQPTARDHVVVVAGRSPEGCYDVLGLVAVTAYRGDDALGLLRSGGARLGADVVSEIRLDATSSSSSISGVALGICPCPAAAANEPREPAGSLASPQVPTCRTRPPEPDTAGR